MGPGRRAVRERVECARERERQITAIRGDERRRIDAQRAAAPLAVSTAGRVQCVRPVICVQAHAAAAAAVLVKEMLLFDEEIRVALVRLRVAHRSALRHRAHHTSEVVQPARASRVAAATQSRICQY